jgi:hypothetical protein
MSIGSGERCGSDMPKAISSFKAIPRTPISSRISLSQFCAEYMGFCGCSVFQRIRLCHTISAGLGERTGERPHYFPPSGGTANDGAQRQNLGDRD